MEKYLVWNLDFSQIPDFSGFFDTDLPMTMIYGYRKVIFYLNLSRIVAHGSGRYHVYWYKSVQIFSPHRVFFSLNFCSYLNHSCSWVQNNQLLWRCIKSSQHLNYINFPHRNCFFTAKTFFEWVFGWQYYNAHR